MLASADCALAQKGGAKKARQLEVETRPWKGDFDQMLERRVIRVAVPYSRSLYYIDKGHERGITADMMRDFEQFLNKKYAKQLRKRPLTVYLTATTRDQLLSRVVHGTADIAAGNLTQTERREEIVDFVLSPLIVRELLVTGSKSPPVASLDELSGKRLHVRKATSYYESVLALNQRLARAGKKPAEIAPLPDALEDEDKLEMLNAGLLEFVVVDDWKAKMWAQVLPKIKVREDLVLRPAGRIGFAIREKSPRLAAEIAEFYEKEVKPDLSSLMAKYYKRVKQIANNTDGAEWKRFEATTRLFEKYGARYGFDPLMLAAQGFQESRLRQEARSPVGAIGVMQLMPATGRDLSVGDITQVEPNIHGGAKYMDHLISNYFPDAKFSEANRTLFAFASYNAGPGNISKMRKEAIRRGLDPDKWFNNVEIVVSEKIGLETTTYVRNIYKYYVAYRLTLAAQDATRNARRQLEAPKN
ncbi:MAG TPA: transglycosylase SLT domain-containing protein [Burkholderiales bacterium]|nr:transglycosylase SLT domain-containing protein [Burkholderiales bacterium]